MAIPNVPGQLTLTQNLQFNETDQEFVRANTAQQLMASSSISAATAIAVTNYNGRGIMAFMTITTAFPGSASLTYTLKVKAVNPDTSATIVLGAAAARSASGVSILTIYPGIAASAGANAQVNMAVPRNLQVVASMSAAVASTNVAMSLGMMILL